MSPLVWIGGSAEGANVRVTDGTDVIHARVNPALHTADVISFVLVAFYPPGRCVQLTVEWLDGRDNPRAEYVEHDSQRLIEAAGVTP